MDKEKRQKICTHPDDEVMIFADGIECQICDKQMELEEYIKHIRKDERRKAEN